MEPWQQNSQAEVDNHFSERFTKLLESQLNLDPLVFFLNVTFSWITNLFTVINIWIKAQPLSIDQGFMGGYLAEKQW